MGHKRRARRRSRVRSHMVLAHIQTLMRKLNPVVSRAEIDGALIEICEHSVTASLPQSKEGSLAQLTRDIMGSDRSVRDSVLRGDGDLVFADEVHNGPPSR